MGANPQHGVGPARQAWAWCWCFCCSRKLELFDREPTFPRDEQVFTCCGRTWRQDQPQPRPRHEELNLEVDRLRCDGRAALALLGRWSGRRPRGMKALLERLRLIPPHDRLIGPFSSYHPGGRAMPIVKGFRDKTVLKAAQREQADPSRNAHKEKGAAVTVNEIAAYRLPLHEKCKRGKGVFILEEAGLLPRRAVACKCAMRRFLKAHPEIIIERTGAVYWPARERDERGDDAAAAISRALDGASKAVPETEELEE